MALNPIDLGRASEGAPSPVRSTNMTDQQTAAYIAALLKERRGAVQYGRADRVEAIDSELRRLGAAGEVPAKRASKRKAG